MDFSLKNIVTASLVAAGLLCASVQAQQAPAAAVNEVQGAIQQLERQAQEADKKAADANAERTRRLREMRREARTPEERAALRAARKEANQKEMAELTPEVRAAREKEQQARRAQATALRAAKEAHAGADASAKNVAKLTNDLAAVNKPDPARGANFTPQNVTPLLKGLDDMTKRLAAVKQPNDMSPQQFAQLEQAMNQLKAYMDRVDDAMVGVQRAGVQTPANKEAEALYARVGDVSKGLDVEMERVEKLFPNVPAVRTAFAKFRE